MRALIVLACLIGEAEAGSLVIHGGGKLGGEVIAEMVERGGGGKLVVIPTAADAVGDGADAIAAWKKAGFREVVVMHTRSREEADTEAFVEALADATAVWFGGGEQARLERAYVGTKVEAAVKAVLERGGVVGGSSAGAAIMSRVMIRGGTKKPRMGTGLGLVEGAIVDQHFVARGREGRLRIALKKHRGLVGLGVDEGTALVVEGTTLSVIGESTVTLIAETTAVLSAGETAELATAPDKPDT
jgi:cyanophycinase